MLGSCSVSDMKLFICLFFVFCLFVCFVLFVLFLQCASEIPC